MSTDLLAPAAAAIAPCLRIDEPLTIAHAAGLHRLLLDWLQPGAQALDLSQVAECDSAGVQLLCAAQRSAAQWGQALTLKDPSEAVVEALHRYGLTTALTPAITPRSA